MNDNQDYIEIDPEWLSALLNRNNEKVYDMKPTDQEYEDMVREQLFKGDVNHAIYSASLITDNELRKEMQSLVERCRMMLDDVSRKFYFYPGKVV